MVRYEMSALEQEELRVILLDIRNRVEHILTIYRGSLNSPRSGLANCSRLPSGAMRLP